MGSIPSQQFTRVGECLYRTGGGKYYALIKVRGKQIRRSLKSTDLPLAKRRLREFREKAGLLIGSEMGMRFEALSERWLASVRPDLKPSSHSRRAGAVGQLTPYFANRMVRDITVADVENWKIARSPQVAARSFNIERETLALMLKYARDVLNILIDNPAEKIKRRKEVPRAIVIPTREQFREMVRDIRENPHVVEAGDLVEFLAYSGMRLGEARAVRWEDVHWRNQTLTITGGEGGTKNNSIRVIPLFPALGRLLERMQAGRRPTGPVFTIGSAKKAIASACKTLGLPHMGHHAFRHYFCSNAIENGVDFKTIAEWLGHKDGGILVAKTYGHLRAELSHAMAARMTFDESA